MQTPGNNTAGDGKPGADEIREAVLSEIAAILSIGRGDVAPDSPLDELGMDSLGFVSLLVFVEKRFGVNLVKTGLREDDLRDGASIAAKIAGAL